MTDPTVYLAGPVAALNDGGASWRDALVDAYPDVDFANPLDHLNAPADNIDIVSGESTDPSEVTVEEIVEADKDLLRESDGVLVGYSRERQIGTPMEVMWAFERDIPVVIWIRDDTPHSELSPWYRYHAAAVTNDRSMAVDALLTVGLAQLDGALLLLGVATAGLAALVEWRVAG